MHGTEIIDRVRAFQQMVKKRAYFIARMTEWLDSSIIDQRVLGLGDKTQICYKR